MSIRPILSQTPTLPIKFIRDVPVLDKGGNYNGDAKGVMLVSKSDNDTVLEFLYEFRSSKSTYKAYSKELERFLLWLEYKAIAISAFMPVNWHEYLDFIEKPKPVNKWVGKRAAKFLRSGKINPSWKVFVGDYEIDVISKKEKLVGCGLKQNSVARVKAVIGSYFSYLVNSSYLIKDPTKVGRLLNKKNSDSEVRKKIKLRMIRPALIDFVLDVLKERKITAIKYKQKAFYPIRARFVIAIFINSGLRLSELANHKMSDIRRNQVNIDISYLDVVGKGGKSREIVLDDETLDIVREYRKELNLGYSLPGENEKTPLVPRIDTRTTIGNTQLHNIVKQSFKYASSVITAGIMSRDLSSEVKAIIDSDVTTLNVASAHWLRHSHATWYHKRYKDLNATKERLGHSDVGTTLIYQHVSDGIGESKHTKEINLIYQEIIKAF